MIISKSKLFLILLVLTILSTISFISPIVTDDNVNYNKGINTIQKRIDSVALKDIEIEDV